MTLTYDYDNNGNITSVSDGTKTVRYEYDGLGQLIRVNDETDASAGSASTTWVFSYDLSGNILTKAAYPYSTTDTLGTAVESHTYTYGNANRKDQLTKLTTKIGNNQLTTKTIQYDAVGNPTNDGTWTYTWQHGKQLASMTRIVGNETVSFEYNEDGLRTKKTVTNGEGTVTTEYVLHGKNIVHMKNGTNEMHFFYDAQGRPAIVVFNGSSYRYMYTLQGDVYGLTNENNSWVVFYRYDAWGKPIGIGGSLANTLGMLQPFRYRGYVFDEETGNYYLRSRYYRPEWGRFVSADSRLTINLYTYCKNSPICRLDKNGTEDILFDDDFWSEDDFPSSTISSPSIPDYTDYINRVLREEAERLYFQRLPDNSLASILRNFESLYEFAKSSWHKARWDIKNRDSWEATFPGIKYVDRFIFRGEETTPHALGNILYGYRGSALGLYPNLLFFGGGVVEHYCGGGYEKLLEAVNISLADEVYYGDKPDDHENIQKGIDYWIDDFDLYPSF